MSQKLKGTLTFIVKVQTYTHTHTIFTWCPVSHYVPSSNISRPRGLIWYHFMYLFSQNEDSSTHEKLDFKLHFTCTSYLITTPCYRLVCGFQSSLRILESSLCASDLQPCEHEGTGAGGRSYWCERCVAFCLGSDAFAKLLESGDLKSSSVRLEGVDMPFHHVLARICFHHHFSGTHWNLWTSHLERLILILKVDTVLPHVSVMLNLNCMMSR